MALVTRDGAVRAEAVLDSHDVEFVRSLGVHWRYESKNGYVLGSKYVGRKQVTSFRLHRVLLGLESPELQGDHINGDGLDNRRANLRILTPAQNNQHRPHPNHNSQSRMRGVYFEPRLGKWRAQCEKRIAGRRKTIHLGCFESKEAAAAAAIAARRQLMPSSLEINA